MQERHHAFSISLPTSDVVFTVDPVRFEQVIINLLNNAAKYTPPGGRINLTASVENTDTKRELVIRVQDNGIGISIESIDQVFEPFRQFNDTPQSGAGLGVGLAIAKRLVVLHQGTIEVFSDGVGKGSTFTVRFPLQTEVAHISTSTAPANSKQKPRQPLKILVVDDNEAAATGIGKLLEHHGHNVSLSHTGEDAISETRSFAPDVVLLDIGLPDIDGYEVAKRLRKNKISSTIIALTGYGQDDDKTEAKNAGIDHHLIKPAGIAEIENILQRIRPETA